MFKKQIQNRITLSLILVAILIGQLGVLLFQAPPANAAGWDFNFLGGVLPEEVNGQVAEPNCTVDKMPITGKIVYSHPSPPRGGLTPVGLGDSIKIYIEMKPTVPNPPTGASTAAPLKKLQENCARQAKEGILNFRLKIINYTGINTEDNYSYVAKLKSEPDGQLAANFPPIVLKNLTRINVIDGNEIGIRIAADFRGTNYKDIAEISFLAQQNPVTTLDTVPTGFETKESNTNPNNEVRKLADIALKTTMLDKYRVLYDEAAAFEQLKFGTNGLKAVSMDWIDPKSSLTRGNYVELPKEYDTSYWPDFTPLFNEFQTGFNYEEEVPKEGAGCVWDKGWVYNTVDCKKGVFINKSIYGDISTVKAGSLPVDSLDPVIYEKAWQDKKPADVTADGTTDKEGKPLYAVKMAHLPIMYLDKSSATAKDWAVLMNKNPYKFQIEVFNTAADIKAACLADGLAEDICNDPQKMRYSVGKEVSSISGTTATPAPTASQTLYAFIVRVISDIIVWLQSIIYRIFAYIVVPIINALLRVRPYQDAFVNVIYPGWLILRNIANIFFIVSLLVVGLRILFQQSAASAARGFIMRLIIMALLVNFSLVIGQGIIGIADTVQSQFLPGNTKIIEALGHKLMVEPLKNFRAEISGGSGNFDSGNSELALSDTIKPIVLLILSIAAFFSFVAIAAFLMVRLVALWVLYMLSPVAYVGFVMDETQKYAKQWWDEFIKYAIMTPVLVFFLNIAALMATVFSSGGDKGLFVFSDGSLSADIVVGSLTILTHFIVLIFIYAGMKFAMGSGTAGAKSIVKYAKKGFDAVTTGAAKAVLPGAKDFIGDQASTGMGKLFGSRAENITQALFKPMEAVKNLKKGAWDRPGEDRKKRSDKRLKNIDDQSYKIMTNKVQALKYAATTAVGRGPKRMYAEGGRLNDEAQILTDDERDAAEKSLAAAKTDTAGVEAQQALFGERKFDKEKGDSLVKGIDKELAVLEAEQTKLEAENLAADTAGDTETKDRTKAELVDLWNKKDNLEAVKKGINDQLGIDGHVNFDKLEEDLKSQDEDFTMRAVFKPEDFKVELENKLKDAKDEENRLDSNIKEDDRRRTDYGYGGAHAVGHKVMTYEDRADLQTKGAEIQEAASKRFLLASLADREGRLSAERDENKKLEDVDDADELIEMFDGAMKKNNMPLATAISKKLAKEGNFDKLLNAKGYENNLKSYQAFMEKHFKGMIPQVKFQIASEVAHVANQNGNSTFESPTKVSGGTMRWATEAESAKSKAGSIEKASSYDLAKKKKYQYAYQQNGQTHFEPSAISNLNSMGKDKLKKFVERKSAKELKDMTKFANYNDLNPDVRRALQQKV